MQDVDVVADIGGFFLCSCCVDVADGVDLWLLVCFRCLWFYPLFVYVVDCVVFVEFVLMLLSLICS